MAPGPEAAKLAAVGAVIDKAEAAYTAGLNDYQSGNLQKAKQEFDRSLSVLLESKYSVLSDDRLSEEFDVLSDNINDVELAALARGNSLSAHQYVATPIESFAGLTFPSNPEVMRRMEAEMRSVHSDIPLISNQAVSGAIAYLQAHARGYVENVLTRIGKYRPMISQVLRSDGLPQDLMYLPGPESAFNPRATSRKSAKGLWQLMSSTAALYGLKENRWVDEREDPYRATQAAAQDLKNLYKMFGDWYLALAAYDCGPLTVQRAIQRTGYADYWTLRRLHVLSAETENYVPVFLATALIAKDPQAYGFKVQPDAPLRLDHVPISTPTDLRLIAGLIDVPADDLREMNPELRGWETPEHDPGFLLNVPQAAGAVLTQRLAEVPAPDRLAWRAHRVESGETLESIAHEYRVTAVALARANHLQSDDTPSGGARLLIPLARVRMASNRGVVRWIRKRFYYRVRAGDTLDLIADRFDASAYQIRRWNHLRSSRLRRGRRLLVYRMVPVHVTSHRSRAVRHTRSRRHHSVRKTITARNRRHQKSTESGRFAVAEAHRAP